MISLKDYAKKKNVSYEAVRKQVNRYRDDLGDHLYKKDRTQYLDEDGEAFLDRKRASNPVILLEHDKDEQIDELKQQNESLKIKIMELQDQLIKSKDQLLERDRQLIELKDELYLLTIKKEESKQNSDASEETEEDGSEETEELTVDEETEEDGPEETEELTADVRPLDETRPEKKKKWWQFWK